MTTLALPVVVISLVMGEGGEFDLAYELVKQIPETEETVCELIEMGLDQITQQFF